MQAPKDDALSPSLRATFQNLHGGEAISFVAIAKHFSKDCFSQLKKSGSQGRQATRLCEPADRQGLVCVAGLEAISAKVFFRFIKKDCLSSRPSNSLDILKSLMYLIKRGIKICRNFANRITPKGGPSDKRRQIFATRNSA